MDVKQKDFFLNSIRGTKLKYKRVNMNPIRYAGGKSLAVGDICELIPDDVEKVVSPFFGGGSVEFAIANGLNIDVVGYDIFPDLVNFYKILKKHKRKLLNILNNLQPTKEVYQEVKQKLKDNWNKKIKLENIEWAAYFYFNHNLSYGPSFLGWMSSIYANDKKYSSLLLKLENSCMDKIKVSCMSFEKILPKHDKDFLYLDPPYFLGGSSKMFAGIYPQRNFPIYHNNFDHIKLAEILKKHKGGFILSYNDCAEIREMYSDCEIIEIQWQYTMGQGETRIGKNRNNNKANNIKESHEILIVKKKED